MPSSAIINQNNNQYVRVVDDIKKGTYHQVQVQTGLQADGGLVEITSRLERGTNSGYIYKTIDYLLNTKNLLNTKPVRFSISLLLYFVEIYEFNQSPKPKKRLY